MGASLNSIHESLDTLKPETVGDCAVSEELHITIQSEYGVTVTGVVIWPGIISPSQVQVEKLWFYYVRAL